MWASCSGTRPIATESLVDAPLDLGDDVVDPELAELAAALGPCVLEATFVDVEERRAYTAEVEGESATVDLDDLRADDYRIFIGVGEEE